MPTSLRIGGRRILASASRTTSVVTSDGLSRFASNGRSASIIGTGTASKWTSGTSLRAASTLASADGGDQSSHRSLSGGLAAGMLAAAALAATAQNAAGDSDSLQAKCCGIAGVVGGENIDAR